MAQFGTIEDVEYLTFSEALKALRISRTTAYRWMEQGTFPVPLFKIGKTWRVSASAIRELSKASQSEASDGLK